MPTERESLSGNTGKSEVDQLFKICSQLGTPDEKRDKEIVNLAKQLNFKVSLVMKIPN